MADLKRSAKKKMFIAALKYLGALIAAIALGVVLALAVTSVLLPTPPPSFAPRNAVVLIFSAWIAGIAFIVSFGALHVIQGRKKVSTASSIILPSLLTTWGIVVLLAFLACALGIIA